MGGHICKKGGRYYVVIEGELDPGTGRRKRLSFPCGIRRRDAERMLVELLGQQRVETFVAPDKPTLGTYLVSEWLPMMSTTLRPSTLVVAFRAREPPSVVWTLHRSDRAERRAMS